MRNRGRFAAFGFGDSLTLEIEGFDEVAELNGYAVRVNPNASGVYVGGNKWTGDKGVTDLKVTYTSKSATFKGSLTGCVVNGVPYGTLVIKGIGSWAVTFSSGCGGDPGGC